MHRLILVLLLLIGCGDRTPQPAPVIANAPATDAGPATDSTTVVTPTQSSCCDSSGVWACNRMPRPGELCFSAGGCCLGNAWTCNRMPAPGECPGASVP